MGRPKRGVTDEQRFWSHVTVGLSAATLGRAAIEGARHAEEDAAIERAASGPVAGLREAIDGLPLFKTRDGASWQFVSKKAVLHLLDAALLAEPVPPERFDRTWWHYADDCPVSPAEPVPLDVAWSEAAASVPPTAFEGVRRSRLGMKDQWVASYSDADCWFNYYGDTPVDALRALAARLTDRKGATE